MSAFIDLTGRKFGRLLVIRRVPGPGKVRWVVRCDCSPEKEKEVQGNHLTEGRVISCGCWAREQNTTHGMTHSRVYLIWRGILNRCRNPNNTKFPYYGGRGIAIAEEWLDFSRFYTDVGDPPGPEYQIDRFPDNDGPYAPGNVRWATRKQQMLNTRGNRLLTFQGQTKPLTVWAEELGYSYSALEGRLRRGWSVERTLTTPLAPCWKKVTHLTPEQVNEIRHLLQQGVTMEAIARRFSISTQPIQNIRKGIAHRYNAYQTTYQAPPFEGVRHKLSKEVVQQIRAEGQQLGSRSYPTIAKKYGVSRPTVSNIVRGVSWRNIP